MAAIQKNLNNTPDTTPEAKCPHSQEGECSRHAAPMVSPENMAANAWQVPIRRAWRRRIAGLIGAVVALDLLALAASNISAVLALVAGVGVAISCVLFGIDQCAREVQRSFQHRTRVDARGQNALMPMHPPLKGVWTVLSAAWRNPRAMEIQRMQDYGEIYAYYSGVTPIVMVTSPELAKDISVRHELFEKTDPRDLGMPFYFRWVGNDNVVLARGAAWRRLRSRITPALGAIEEFVPVFEHNARLFIRKIDSRLSSARAPRHAVVRVASMLKGFSLDNAGQTLFTFDFRHLQGARNTGIGAGDYVLAEVFNPTRRMLPLLNILPTIRNLRLKRSMRQLDRLVEELILAFRLQPRDRHTATRSVLELLVMDKESGALRDSELRNNILAMLVASYETTQSALGAELYFLAKYPKHQESLRSEVSGLFPDFDSDFLVLTSTSVTERSRVLRKIQASRMLDNFILECLRLHSPLSVLNVRTALADCELGGYQVPKGTLVTVNVHALHMNPAVWPEPTRFDPERFRDATVRTRFAQMAFGGGPRSCAGRAFTVVEQKIIICHLLKRFRIELPHPDYSFPVQATSFTGQQKPSFSLRFVELGS